MSFDMMYLTEIQGIKFLKSVVKIADNNGLQYMC
jgi:hypothetical protein